ncbi:MAG: SDR family oxidoreductase [Alphaproteobacteria bacterium]|nr:SDR family oxidoreductase [Alphaproteobacteria bacterium]
MGPRGRALVTGASAGIGEAFARELARRGWSLVLVARRESRLASLRATLERDHGVSVEVLAADLLDPAACAEVEARLARDDIELLVNSAGFGPPGVFADQDPAHLTRVIRLNTEVLMRLTHAALGPMRARRSGRIVQLGSTAGFQPDPYFAVYGATKAFVLSFSQAVHEECRGHGVQVLALCPGLTRSEFQDTNDAHAEDLPAWMWSEPDAIVQAALRSLERDDAVLVPRWHDWLAATLATLGPRKWVRRVTAWATGRM